MPRELDLLGLLIPSLLLVFVAALIGLAVLDHFAGRHDWYRHVWHPALFRLAVFACLFGGLGLLAMR